MANIKNNHVDWRGQLMYRQWQAFASVLRSLKIEHKILGSVYYRRHRQLVLPGSNLTSLVRQLDGPQKLHHALREYSPNPENARDRWAADVACRHFLRKECKQEDECMIAPFTWGSESFRALIVDQAGHATPLQEEVTLPRDFAAFLRASFEAEDPQIKQLVFSACPVTCQVQADMTPTKNHMRTTEHVAIFYIGLQQTSQDMDYGPIAALLMQMRELMALGIFAFEIENETTWQERLQRIRAPEASKEDYVSKLFPGDRDGMRQQVRHISYLAKASRRSHQRQLLYPKVSPQTHPSVPYYKMPKYNLPPLRDLICGPQHPMSKHLDRVVERLIETVFAGIYTVTKRDLRVPSSAFAKKQVKERLDRLGRVFEALQSISLQEPILYRQNARLVPERESHRVLRILLNPNARDVNVTAHVSLPETQYDVKMASLPLTQPEMGTPQTQRRLSCTTLTATHGDLHFGNVLVDCFLPSDPLFLLIDPRGVKSTHYRHSDPAFDIGKLLFSCEAGYDYVDIGHFDIDVVETGTNAFHLDVTIPSSRTLYNPMGGGASAAELFSVEQSLPRQTKTLYKRAAQVIRDRADAMARSDLGDRHILDRAEFYMAMYCLCMAESHYLYKPEGALALFVCGHDLLTKWLTKEPLE